MKSFARVAYIASTRNLNGSVVCKAADALPFLLTSGQLVHFVPPTLRGPRQAKVLSVEETRPGSWDANFEGIDTIESAEAITGCYCLVAEDELPEVDPSESPRVLLGFSVEDATFGHLGEVISVQENPAHATLEVGGVHGLVLIPLVEEFVSRIEEEQQLIYTTVSESLLTLNANTEGEA